MPTAWLPCPGKMKARVMSSPKAVRREAFGGFQSQAQDLIVGGVGQFQLAALAGRTRRCAQLEAIVETDGEIAVQSVLEAGAGAGEIAAAGARHLLALAHIAEIVEDKILHLVVDGVLA